MYRGIIFDLDDTLYSEKDYILSGFKAVSEHLANELVEPEENIFENLVFLFHKSSIEVFNRLLDIYGFKYDKNLILKLVDIYRCHVPKIALYEDARDLICYLKNEKIFKLGIITDGHMFSQKNKINALGLNKSFDSIIITDELGKEYWKPSKEPYIRCCNNLTLSFEQCMYIGDNLEKDFISARELGIFTVQVKREDGVYSHVDKGEPYKADIVVNSLKEIYSFIK